MERAKRKTARAPRATEADRRTMEYIGVRFRLLGGFALVDGLPVHMNLETEPRL